jgi:hypothetical protein
MIETEHRVTNLWIPLSALLLVVAALALVRPAYADLPTRPEDVPTPKPVTGGAIQLHIAGYREGLWAVVQWQDGLGNWHDVEGWRGTPDEERVMWYVHKRDFDKGPFRWALYDGPAGELLVASESFYLPGGPGEVIHVSVSLIP